MSYNAMDDAMKIRVMRNRVNDLINAIPPTELLIIVLDLINPAYTRPILIGLRDNLSGMTNDKLDALLAGLPD
jgi:hypothetical protein